MSDMSNEYHELLQTYEEIKYNTQQFDSQIQELNKKYQQTLGSIKWATSETLQRKYKKGLKIIDNISELMSKRSVMSRHKFIETNLIKAEHYINEGKTHEAKGELDILKRKLSNPPVKYREVHQTLFAQLHQTYEHKKDSMFYQSIAKRTETEISMDQNIAIIKNGTTSQQMKSMYVTKKLSKLANKEISIGDTPIYATSKLENGYLNLTIIERKLTDKGLIANRHFIKIPENEL